MSNPSPFSTFLNIKDAKSELIFDTAMAIWHITCTELAWLASVGATIM